MTFHRYAVWSSRFLNRYGIRVDWFDVWYHLSRTQINEMIDDLVGVLQFESLPTSQQIDELSSQAF
jgi:hypothetical protein